MSLISVPSPICNLRGDLLILFQSHCALALRSVLPQLNYIYPTHQLLFKMASSLPYPNIRHLIIVCT